MLSGFDFPVEECPASRVKAGYVSFPLYLCAIIICPGLKKFCRSVVRYIDACRKFDYVSDQNLAHCKNYLDESNIYFLGDDG